jgi:hypothetical protein
MIGVGPSLTHKTLGSSKPQGGPILQFERQCRQFENFDYLPRLSDIWLLAELFLLGGVAKFFKLEHKDKLKEGY